MKKNRKNAFTLIELLAVIVILAIIALIATPIVINIIEDSKNNAMLRSADNYLDAVEQALTKENMNKGGSFNPNTCTVTTSGNLLCGSEELTVEVNGEKPNSGSISFNNGNIGEIKLTYSNGKTIVKNDKGELVYKVSVCKVRNGDGTKTGDEIDCFGEKFYVIKNDGEKISMLSKYNLNVGSNINSKVTVGIQHESIFGGYKNGFTRYGQTHFSKSGYWWDYSTNMYTVDLNYQLEERTYPYLYGDYSDNLIYTYIDNYINYLNKKGLNDVEGNLISYEQLEFLGCDTNNCLSSEHQWVYNTTYWTGSGKQEYYLWYVSLTGNLSWNVFDCYAESLGYGIRPVIYIPISEI